MVRQSSKRPQSGEQNQDMMFLLSCIRSRENALIFFLELFTMSSTQKLAPEQYGIYKQEFLQKQKINTHQIKITAEKLHNNPLSQTQTKTFWMKLKSILRVSVERARTLNMLTEALQNSYDTIIRTIDGFYQSASPLKEYLVIEQLSKKRTIDALMATKHILTDHPSQQFGKIRSETFLKGHIKPQTISYSPPHKEPQLGSLQEMAGKEQRKTKRKDKKNKLDSKKITNSLNRYQRNLGDVMEMRIDYHVDKKKGQAEVESILYDVLFGRNIANHKIITKYAHSCGRLLHKIMQMKRNSVGRRQPSHAKPNKRLLPQPTEIESAKLNSSKPKLTRPKTCKQTVKKTLVLKGASVRTEKVHELVRVA